MDDELRRIISELYISACCMQFIFDYRAGLAQRFDLITHNEREMLRAAIRAYEDHSGIWERKELDHATLHSHANPR